MSERHLTAAMFYILLSLADRPRHGLGIVGDVEERTGYRVKIGPALLYTSLRRLEAGSLVEVATPPADEATDPRRKYYRITQRGRRAVREEAELLEVVVMLARDRKVLPRGSNR